MSETKSYEKLLQILEGFGSLPDRTDSDYYTYRYLDDGLIDSMSLIAFIDDIEEAFGIDLSPDDTQSEDFRTVKGLLSILQKKRIDEPS